MSEPASLRMSPKRLTTLSLGLGMIGLTGWWSLHQSQPTSMSGPVMLAVAPFRVVGPGLEPWSGAGLAAQIRGALDTISGMSARLADREAEAAAAYLIRGTITREGSRNAIVIQLARRGDREVLWTGTYWRGDSDLTSLSSDLAQAVMLWVRQDAARNDRRR